MEIFARIHILSRPNDLMALNNVDIQEDVLYLKQEIARKIKYDALNIELVYNGCTLEDDQKLEAIGRPSAIVHCFSKTRKYTPYQPTEAASAVAATAQVQELFNVTAHVQINVHSRVNILQKILAEYPEFRRNLGAQALIRDSVLFNTLHQPEVIKNIAEHYPIICEAAAFIVDTIKKELTRSTVSEPATDSTNSSEEENSLGSSSGTAGGEAENAQIRRISRQQLRAALQQIGLSSVNSLSNIAQRNSDSNTTTPTTGSATTQAPGLSGGDRASRFQRALRTFGQAESTTMVNSDVNQLHEMDTSDLANNSAIENPIQDTGDDIPAHYRLNQYAEQLRTMAQMGFTNYEENLSFLTITNGNIENAINLIMGSIS